jgi:predicted TIM-barrel fold metal-dependent hydrolase
MSDRDATLGSASRRDFIVGLAATGAAAALVPALGGFAAAASPMRRIDFHHHFMPQQYLLDEQTRFGEPHGNSEEASWTADRAIQACDLAGVDFAFGSISTPGVWFGDVALGRKLARQWNEAAGQVVRDHPTRFGFFAPIPLPDTDGSLKEIEYAYGTLHADGINLLSNYAGKWLGDPAFTPVMEELDRRKSIVYVHPTFGPCCTKNMVTGLIAPNLEFPFDTTRTIISLVTSGTTTRFPNIRFVFSHGGGALFGVYGRLENLGTAPQFKDKFPAGMVAELKKLYYDTASMNAETSITALLRGVPSSQLLLGSDYPLVATKPLNEAIVRAVAEFEEYKPSPQLKAQVERDNAMRLVPRLAKV